MDGDRQNDPVDIPNMITYLEENKLDVESRDCRKATIIISQVPVAKWYTMFGNNTYADACLSSMTSKAYRLEFPGRDRRLDGNN